ncbi:MAG: PP2C family protein-serine/threonine phosphatase [Microcystaceae cyanobacterium]
MVELLVIDDSLFTQRLLQRILTDSGYEVILATNGKEGLAKAKARPPALIICDWLMPEMSGVEVCHQVKQIPELSTTFFILFTSLVSIEDRIQGLDAGADDFLLKPIEPGELLARVRAGVRLHHLSQDLKRKTHILESELLEAADYVHSILPDPLYHKALRITSRFIPSRQLGGDGFDYFWLDENHLALHLLDVAGHGLRAALPSLSVINLLRSRQLNQINYYSPRSVLTELNQVFQTTLKNDKYFTMWYGVFNCQTQQLCYGSAGHPPGILFTFSEHNYLRENYLKTKGFPIGLFPDATYEETVITIQAPASLYIFSDGIYEIEKTEGLYLNMKDFLPILREYQQLLDRQLEKLLDLLQKAYERSQFEDDLSILQVDFL